MATKQTYYAGLASILLIGAVSCSQEEILDNEPNAPRKTIGFNVTADRATRATDIFSSTHLPPEFLVMAWIHNGEVQKGQEYFHLDHFQKNEDGSYTNSTDLRYWPTKDEFLNFYAIQNGTDNYPEENTPNLRFYRYINHVKQLSPYIEEYHQFENTRDHHDLMYACAFDQKETTAGTVNLQFKHALAQVGFKAVNNSRHIHVEVEEVTIFNMVDVLSFYIPATSNDSAYWSDDPGMDRQKMVSDMGTFDENGEFTPGAVVLPERESTSTTGESVWLTSDKRQMFMLQPFAYKEVSGTDYANSRVYGSYFRIKCKVWNIAYPDHGFLTQEKLDTVVDDDDPKYPVTWGDEFGVRAPDVLIHDGYIYIPYKCTWEMGKKYIFTISFGQGTAGLDGNGQPTFVKVSVPELKVDEWGDNPTAVND